MSGEFPFLPPTTQPKSSEEIGLNVVFDMPALDGAEPGRPADEREPAACVSGGDLGHDDAGGRWPSLLLISYASAVTLALGWILWTGRRLTPPPAAKDESRLSAPDIPPTQGPSALATADEPPPPLPLENLTTLGGPIRLGAIEVTPIAVERCRPDLVRTVDPGEWQQPKGKSLLLKIMLRNVSSAWTIAPLELFTVRDCPGIPGETFLESDRGRIGMYPLALESEWSLAGQQFPTLGPGETAETLIATAAIPKEKLADRLTWRIRLRVTPLQTDVVGITFSRGEIVDR